MGEMNTLENVNLEIKRVYAGWFDMVIRYDGNDIQISASDAWGNDAPRELLKALREISDKESMCKYVIFDEEPGSYVVCLERDKDTRITIIATDISSDEWEKLDLYGDLSYEEINDYVIHRDSEPDVLMQEYINLEQFAGTAVRAFEEYRMGESRKKYNDNWMEFPDKELMELKDMINRNRDD